MVNEVILVTGGTGLVGSACKKVMPEAHYVGSGDFDLRNYEECVAMFEQVEPDAVLHLAGKVGGLKANTDFPGDFFEDNIYINTNVLKCAKDRGIKNVLSFLSTCIFPAKAEYPLREPQLHKGEPHYSNFAYAYAKRMLEVQGRAYSKQHGLYYKCAIPTNIYGPHDNFNLDDSHVVPALIHKCYLAKKDGTDFVVWGSGKPLREFIYSEDVARLAKWALTENHNQKIIFSKKI